MSEQTIGRITRKGRWDRRYATARCPQCGAPRHPRSYSQPVQYDPAGSSIGEILAGVFVLLLLFGAVFWAMPVIAEYVR